MIKICYITTVSITLKTFVLELAKYLYSTGEFDISFVCDEDEAFASSLPSYIHYYPVKMNRGISPDGVKAMFEIKKILKEQQFDIVQYSTPNASFYTALASSMAKVPVRLYCQWGIAYVGFSGLKRTVFKAIEKLVCKLSTWIEPDSFGNRRFSQSEGLYTDEKSSVIWNGSASGVNLTKFDIRQKSEWREAIRAKHGIPQDATVLVFIGRITKDKGINELFEAMQSVLRTKNDVYLLMLGSEENTASLDETLFAWSKQEPRVIYGGYTNTVEQYLAASDVYILPSYRDGFGSAVVEAEAMGLPVIVTDIPGPTDAMQRDVTGLVVPKADAAALAKAIETLCDDRDMRDAYGEAAYRFATENFEQQLLFSKIREDRVRLVREKS